MKKYIKLMRVKHYIKNTLIFLPLIFNGDLLKPQLLLRSIGAFLTFSLIASVIYIVNDIFDIEKDRKHSTKCHRPIASGEITIKKAEIFAFFLLASGIIVGIIMNNTVQCWMLLTIYFCLNIIYSKGLKNVPIVDIAILVSGFLIRILYGSFVTSIEISNWLYLTVIAISFYLGLGKRRNELLQESGKSRKVLSYYNYEFLDKNMQICMGLAITFYALWSVDVKTLERVSNPYLVWTVPLVIIVCMKYSLNVEKESSGDPVDVIYGDKILSALILLLVLVILGIIYI